MPWAIKIQEHCGECPWHFCSHRVWPRDRPSVTGAYRRLDKGQSRGCLQAPPSLHTQDRVLLRCAGTTCAREAGDLLHLCCVAKNKMQLQNQIQNKCYIQMSLHTAERASFVIKTGDMNGQCMLTLWWLIVCLRRVPRKLFSMDVYVLEHISG